ncbi:restriction endonuclease [Dehalococcoidia bacterium]|nr:restriction endonuclease [Dehalococcoidia bacterium]
MKVISFAELSNTDLTVDALYEGGSFGSIRDEPLSKLLSIQNLGGFRYSGTGGNKNFVVLYSSGENPDWPDSLDVSTGIFRYFGDNREQGDIHETERRGNLLLKECFDAVHLGSRLNVPPFFIFAKAPTEKSSRTVQFRGLAVPGSKHHSPQDDLVAVWRSSAGNRFQNYISMFTILDENIISRDWIQDLLNGVKNSNHAPDSWRRWVETGTYTPLKSEPNTNIRSREQQTPSDLNRRSMLETIYRHFSQSPTDFESFAAEVYTLMNSGRAVVDTITRPTSDGGRDALGKYQLGLDEDPVWINFALEAKCYNPGLDGSSKASVCGVRSIARLASRLRYREFGIIVTTSYFGKQAYEEIRSDGTPIILICGKDIVDILVNNDINTSEKIRDKLTTEYPV